MATPSISDFDLRLGDNDAKRRWGGETRKLDTGDNDVAQLKAALVAVGVLEAKKVHARGVFDIDARAAVVRLQWYLATVPGYLDTRAAFVDRAVDTGVAQNGVATELVRATLRTWVAFGFSCAGNLVRGKFADYANIEANSGFTFLLGPDEFVVDRGFTSAIAGAQALADAEKLTVHVNQMFRTEGTAVSGAVVQPASFSAHKIGRAVDLQLSEAGKPTQLSAAIRSAPAKSAFGRFRDGMKRDYACRYGGDFATVDPPHFDRQIMPPTNLEWRTLFFFNQRQIREARRNVEAVPPL